MVYLIVYCASQFFEDRSEVGAPPHVATGECKKNVKWTYVLQLGDHVVSDSLPVLGGAWDLLEN